MKNCKFCQAEMEDSFQFCPACGKNCAEEGASEEMTAPEAPEVQKVEVTLTKEGAKVTPGKIALIVAAVVVLLAALIALISMGMKKNSEVVPAETAAAPSDVIMETEVPATIPADGEAGTVTEKGTYTVSDEEVIAARDTVVARVGDAELTNGELQVYYWMAVQGFLNSDTGYYVMMYGGLDYTQPLDTQVSMIDQNLTWQQYFLWSALDNWQQVQGMSAEAAKAGLAISDEDQEYLDNVVADLEATAESYGVTLEELMKANVGAGAGVDEFVKYQMGYRKGLPYYNAEVEKMVPTEADLEAYFASHEEDYANNGITRDAVLVDVRHILLTPTSTAGDGTYSDEDWAACEAAAQQVLDTWLAGDKTEDSFAALANEHSTDPGSNTNGGLYTDVYVGQMVQPFNDWCFDESRQYGDTGLVRTDYGYHVMFYVENRPQWKQYAESDWKSEKTNEMLAALVESYPLEAEYGKIALGLVTLG